MMKQALHAPVRGGYTLVELMIALAGASVLLVGISSTMFIALEATDTSNTPTPKTIEGNAALNDLLADLEFALSFSEQTANAMTFTVPDRDGDSNPETIRYAWSGTPGDPLTRQYNAGTVATLVENIHVFQHDLPTPTSNLLSNPGMESGTTDWQSMPGAVISSTSTEQFAGAYSMLVQKDAAGGVTGAEQSVASNLANNATYDLSVWTKEPGSGGANVFLSLMVESTGEGVQVFSGPVTGINGGSWTQVTASLTPSWTGSILSAYWRIEGVAANDPFLIDDAQMVLTDSVHQHVNIGLQVGPDARSQLHSGRQLLNSPL